MVAAIISACDALIIAIALSCSICMSRPAIDHSKNYIILTYDESANSLRRMSKMGRLSFLHCELAGD